MVDRGSLTQQPFLTRIREARSRSSESSGDITGRYVSDRAAYVVTGPPDCLRQGS